MAKAAAKRKGASRNSRAGGKGVPGWLLLMLGLAIGVFGAFLWHLSELRREVAKQAQATASALKSPADGKAPATDKKPEQAGQPAKPEEKRFEFYTLLPGRQVTPGKKSGSTTPPPSKTPQEEPAYVLQAGSFKSEAEADKRRATILMLGLPVKIVKVPVKPGETWYRVVVGPFAGKTAAQSARTNLHGNGVDTLVIKQG